MFVNYQNMKNHNRVLLTLNSFQCFLEGPSKLNYSVQKRFNNTGLRLLSLERPAGKAGLWLSSGNFDFCRVLIIHKMMPRLFLQTIWFIVNTCFPPRSLEFGCVLGRVCLRDQLPVKTSGAASHTSFPGGCFTFVITSPCWRNLTHPVWLCWEETLGSLHLVSSSHSLTP